MKEVNEMVFNSYGRLRRVLLCEPTYYEICSFSEVAIKNLTEGFKVSREAAVEQHREFTDVFRQLDVDIDWMVAHPGHPDLCATRDFGVNTAKGILIGNFRYLDNEGDKEIAVDTLNRLEVPMIGRALWRAAIAGISMSIPWLLALAIAALWTESKRQPRFWLPMKSTLSRCILKPNGITSI
jgi:hypothetical protein